VHDSHASRREEALNGDTPLPIAVAGQDSGRSIASTRVSQVTPRVDDERLIRDDSAQRAASSVRSCGVDFPYNGERPHSALGPRASGRPNVSNDSGRTSLTSRSLRRCPATYRRSASSLPAGTRRGLSLCGVQQADSQACPIAPNTPVYAQGFRSALSEFSALHDRQGIPGRAYESYIQGF
jgi:hypothetical protein